MNRGARLILTFMGTILVLTGTGFTWGLFHSYQKSAVTRDWTPVPCRVLHSGIVRDRFSPNSPETWRAEVTYRYEAGGETRAGSRIRTAPEGPTPHRDRAETLAARYPAGQDAVCYFNPADPSEAVLEKGTRAAVYTLWWPMLFAVGGAGMIRAAWRKPSSVGAPPTGGQAG